MLVLGLGLGLLLPSPLLLLLPSSLLWLPLWERISPPMRKSGGYMIKGKFSVVLSTKSASHARGKLEKQSVYSRSKW